MTRLKQWFAAAVVAGVGVWSAQAAMTHSAAVVDTRADVLAEVLPASCTYALDADAVLTVMFKESVNGKQYVLPDNMGSLKLDLNGQTLVGAAGSEGGASAPGGNGAWVFQIGEGTAITVLDNAAPAGAIVGGKGGNGTTAGAGAYAFVDSDGAQFAVQDAQGLVSKGADGLAICTVTLNANGGAGGTASVTATYGAAMPSATMPTKEGYKFLGYFDAQTDGVKYYNADGSSAANWDKTANTTLYAQWAAPGEAGDPWQVGTGVVAYTNGTGGLVISGTGAAGDFSKQNPAPWAAFADQIKSVTIADGVESIGSRFFKGCTRLGTVTGGKNLVSVGENAFYQCMSLETIKLDNAAVLDTLKNAIVYQTAIDAEGKPYVIPFIDIPGYKNVLYGTVDLVEPKWVEVPEGTTMEESGYHFFKFVLEAVK